MKKQVKYKVGVYWWVGWWVLLPVRAVAGVLIYAMFICHPAFHYGFFNCGDADWETDQSKWKL